MGVVIVAIVLAALLVVGVALLVFGLGGGGRRRMDWVRERLDHHRYDTTVQVGRANSVSVAAKLDHTSKADSSIGENGADPAPPTSLILGVF